MKHAKTIRPVFFVLVCLAIYSSAPANDNPPGSAIPPGDLIVHLHWPNWNDGSHGNDKFAFGENVSLYGVISGFPEDQSKDILDIPIDIWNSDKTKLLGKYPGRLATFLAKDPNIAGGAPSHSIHLKIPMPAKTEITDGDYILTVKVKDAISGKTGEKDIKFSILPHDTFMLVGSRFVMVNATPEDDRTRYDVDWDYKHSGFIFPLIGIPAFFTKINGYALDSENQMNLKVHLTLYDTEDKVIHNHTYNFNTDSYNGGDAYPVTALFHNNYPGVFVAEIRVEDLNSGKTITQRYPYFIISTATALKHLGQTSPVPVHRMTDDPKTENETPKPGQK